MSRSGRLAGRFTTIRRKLTRNGFARRRVSRAALDRADVAVVGGGVAGLTAALTASAGGARVLLLSKGRLLDSGSSFWAQGGIAAAIGSDDTPDLHGCDTIEAGRRLSRPTAVRVLVEEAPAHIEDLRSMGVPFAAEIGLEGGHSRRRVVNVQGAQTGSAVTRVLAERVAADPRITVLEGERVVGLLVGGEGCAGVVTARGATSCQAVVLATGGAAGLWARTTNPAGNVGDGIGVAYAAGAAVADLEFVQFHPTVLEQSGFLLSEALRGEGALLVGADGRRFTDELAPRDVVARAVGAHRRALLDLRSVDRSRFPGLMARLEAEGFEPGAAPIPIVPAAHYTMGGVVTDLHGRTELPGLLAAGECACTGVHGANRLASNSLLECLVFGRRAGHAALAAPPPARDARVLVVPADELAIDETVRAETWECAGLVRDAAALERLRRSRALLARLVAECALARTESRGGHFRADHPHASGELDGLHTVLRRDTEFRLERWL